MNCRLVAFLALGCVALAAPSTPAQRRGPRGGDQAFGRYGWLASLESGQAEARKSGKPLMVVLRCQP
jgi:hypothetical protein